MGLMLRVRIGIIRMVGGRVLRVIGLMMERVRRRRVGRNIRYRLAERKKYIHTYKHTKTWKIKKDQ
jgi:hypothetical protein